MANITFSFRGPNISVSLIGDYDDKRLAAEPDLDDIAPVDEEIHYYAIVASAIPDRRQPNFLPNFFANVVYSGEAAELGREVALGEGKTLKRHSTLKRQRLTEGKVLILGVFNASRDENQWFVVQNDPNRQIQVSAFPGTCISVWG